MTPRQLFAQLHERPPSEAEGFARRAGAVAQGPVVAASACLLGIRCRYDGAAKPLAALADHPDGLTVIPLCPEVLAGLGTPRPPMVFVGGDGASALRGGAVVLDQQGRDCTAALRNAAETALVLARAAGCERVIGKERSPSCGVLQVHTRKGLIPGSGLFTAVCRRAGLPVIPDEAW
ncbi:DUF523 domain-containing protein [Myxococcota bacterium]